MRELRVMVYLSTGAEREHVMVAEDDDDYLNQMNYYVDALKGEQGSLVGFNMPSSCIYKTRNIVAIEFRDPPPPSDKLPLGFIKSR